MLYFLSRSILSSFGPVSETQESTQIKLTNSGRQMKIIELMQMYFYLLHFSHSSRKKIDFLSNFFKRKRKLINHRAAVFTRRVSFTLKHIFCFDFVLFKRRNVERSFCAAHAYAPDRCMTIHWPSETQDVARFFPCTG